jgi:hypothetical protein
MVKQIVRKRPSDFNIPLTEKSVATYVTSDKDVGLGIAYDVPSRDDCISTFYGLPVSRIMTPGLGRYFIGPCQLASPFMPPKYVTCSLRAYKQHDF